MAKRELAPDGNPMSNVHLVFEEWFKTGYVRVSVRGDGWYAVELDGPIRWSGPRSRPGLRWARRFYSAGKGAFPFMHHLGEFSQAHYMMRTLGGGDPPLKEFPPCPFSGDDASGSYHASMTVTLEIYRVDVLRSWWTSPECPGFPRAIAGDAWDLVERITAGTVKRPTWHASTPDSSASSPGRPSGAPE